MRSGSMRTISGDVLSAEGIGPSGTTRPPVATGSRPIGRRSSDPTSCRSPMRHRPAPSRSRSGSGWASTTWSSWRRRSAVPLHGRRVRRPRRIAAGRVMGAPRPFDQGTRRFRVRGHAVEVRCDPPSWCGFRGSVAGVLRRGNRGADRLRDPPSAEHRGARFRARARRSVRADGTMARRAGGHRCSRRLPRRPPGRARERGDPRGRFRTGVEVSCSRRP